VAESKSSKVDRLKLKRDQINARIQTLEAAEKTRARKQDTRRKILVGAYTLKQADDKGGLGALYQAVRDFLTRDSDKALFEPVTEKKAKAKAALPTTTKKKRPSSTPKESDNPVKKTLDGE